MKFIANLKTQNGFTLIELIGVMAVIAILAAATTPRIIEAIDDAKITTYIQEVQTIKVAATRFYKDTGRWPIHSPSSTTTYYHQLMENRGDSAGNPIPGWNGPYLERELIHQLNRGSAHSVTHSSDAIYACDTDGDGTRDGSFLIYRTDAVSDKFAKRISEIFDKDSAVTSGNERWQASGHVRRYGTNSDSTTIMIHCLASI